MAFTRLRVRGPPVYVDRTALPQLRAVASIVFDCDGVLIDIRRSYDTAIQRTATYLVRRLTGLTLPRDFVSPQVIYTFRRSGGFNNDWDTTYALLLFLFTQFPRAYLRAWTQAVGSAPAAGRLGERVRRIEHRAAELSAPVLPSPAQAKKELFAFAQGADATGAAYVDRQLLDKRKVPSETVQALRALKRLLGYPARPGRSLLATVFSELFYGPDLYHRIYGLTPEFGFVRGTLEAEKPIVSAATLDALQALVGQDRFGIASGRASQSAARTLQSLLAYFNPQATVFIEDLAASGEGPPFEQVVKPHPYALLRAAQVWDDDAPVLYVGDSAEDLLMARRANEAVPRFLFAGVYAQGIGPTARIRQFQREGAHLILPSVNELPTVLVEVRR